MGKNRNDGQSPKPQVLIRPNSKPGGESRHAAMLPLQTCSVQWSVNSMNLFALPIQSGFQYELLSAQAVDDFETPPQQTQQQPWPEDIPDQIDLEAAMCFLREDIKKYIQKHANAERFDLTVNSMNPRQKVKWMLRSVLNENQLTAKAGKGF